MHSAGPRLDTSQPAMRQFPGLNRRSHATGSYGPSVWAPRQYSAMKQRCASGRGPMNCAFSIEGILPEERITYRGEVCTHAP